MASSKDAPNKGTAATIESFLKQHVGETLTAADVREALDLDPNNSSLYGKLSHLCQQGRVRRDDTHPGRMRYLVLPEILDARSGGRSLNNKQNGTNKINGQASQQTFALTPQGRINLNHYEAAKRAPQMDITQMMQHIINVDEQNKLYRNALESIVLILEQTGIIETE